MKKQFLTFCLTLLAVVCLCTGARAEVGDNLAVIPEEGNGTPENFTMVQGLDAMTVGKLDVTPQATAAAQSKAPARRVAVSSTQSLAGAYVSTYSSLTTSGQTNGTSTTVTALGTDSITLYNFGYAGFVVKAAVDLTTGTVTIPNQVVYNHSTYGDCDIATCTTAGKPDRATPITGVVNADGSITFDGWWAVFVVSGTSADGILVAGYQTAVEKANGTMVTTVVDTTTVYNWNVVVKQTGKNLVTVKNFGNHGQTIEVILNSDSTITIAQQIAWQGGSTLGDFYVLAANWDTGKTSSGLKGTVAGSTLSWGQWILYSTNRYYTGKYNSTTLTTDFEFSIPTLSVSEFQGSGTEADPWQIKTLDDLILLAQKVNNDTERLYGYASNPSTRTFLGKYFKVMNDIDMSDYRFDPIGHNYNQRFAGTFDGGGYTLTGLDVSTGSTGYAGLFGRADTVSVIKNVTLKDAKVSSSYYYTAGIVGFSEGSIDNCNVTGDISGYVSTAGIVGVGTNVTNCTFEGTVSGTGGVAGGIAGQVYTNLHNCHASGTVATSANYSGYTVGGVVATLYGASSNAENCYFNGVVDGSQTSGLYVGGVVGQVYRGKVDRCFAMANIAGYDNTACVGGVVGVLAGDLSNSYASGYVRGVSSRYVGGITGAVRSYVIAQSTGNDTVQSSVKNCYYAGRLDAEDYLYDTETEVRETLGTIVDGATPTVENIYFDKQMVDYNSAKYGVLTSDLTSASGPTGFDATAWAFAEGYYPRIKGLEDTPEAQQSASVLKLDSEFPDNVDYVSVAATLNLLGGTQAYAYVGQQLTKQGNNVTIDGNNVTLNGTFGTDTLVFYNPQDASITPRYFILQVAPKYFDGLGKADNPFLIKTKSDLMKLGELTTEVGQLYKNVYFLQTADIDMENDTTFLCISAPISDYTNNRFSGVYDGGGHAIHNLSVNFVSWTKKPTSHQSFDGTPNNKGERTVIYKGLFGQLEAGAVVKNLTIASDCVFDVWGYAGVIVGYNYGTVENCRNFADIYSYSSTVGGIVGYNNPGAVVRGCYNAGNVYCGYFCAGGIVGNNTGTIENCQNVGNVSVQKLSTFQTKTSKFTNAGGIAGSTSGGVLRNLVNSGHVFAWSKAGGIAGSYNSTLVKDGNNDFTGGLSYGTVFCPDELNRGAIGGNGYNPAAETKAVYYDKQLLGLSASAADAQPGVTSCTTAELTSGVALEGLDADVYTFVKGQYPVLTSFASEPLAQAASKIVLTLSDSVETTRNILSNATMSQTEGTTWQLAQGTSFGISGSTLTVPAVTSSAILDTLTATLDGFVRPIALTAVTPVPLDGSGTETDPFQLKTTTDWNNLANYISEAANSLEGQYVKVMNDIDFTDVTFTPLAFDAITPFGGTLLGNNCTIKGISYTTTATYQGAIVLLGVGAVVRDLTLQGTITTAKSYTGGFVGNMKGALVNCTNEIAVTATATYAGGFAGSVTESGSFTGCTNKAAVTSSKAYVAGFAGKAVSKVSFTDCVNEGTVTCTGSAVNGVAGFVATGGGTVFTRCTNKGAIVGEKAYYAAGLQGYSTGSDTIYVISCANVADITGQSCVAGITAGMPQTSSYAHSALYAVDSYNTGDISSSTNKYYGVSGLFAIVGPQTQILHCYNTGSVVVTSAGVYTGAIWGYAIHASTAEEGLIARGCYNTGGVIGINYGAGIGGYIPDYATLDSCYNTGEINASFGASGIGNIMGNDVYITNCWNSGNISTVKQGAGGINGYGAKRAHVTNCFNTGDVSGGSNAGGLGGQSMAIYTNCYNRGTVTAPAGVGGLVGKPSFNSTYSVYSTSFINCYNAGRVINNDSTVGNLVGVTSSTSWKAGSNVITDSYYVTDFGSTYDADSVGGTPITVAELAKSTDLPGNWYYGDDYSFPVISGQENLDCAKAFAAAVVLNGSDTYDNVTNYVTLGYPAGVTWSDSGDLCNFWDIYAGTKAASQTDDVFIATCGDFQAKWPVTFNTTTGVSDVQSNKQVLSRTYYNVAGVQVAQPEAGQIYIEVLRYTDGTAVSNKIAK